jgi:integrase
MARRTYRTGSLLLRGRIWWIRYYRYGKRYQESTNCENRADAVKVLQRRLGDIAANRFQGLAAERLTVSKLFDLVVEDYEISRRRTLKDVKWRIEAHLRKKIGPIRASRFGQPQIAAYIADRRAEGASDATINREIAIVRRGFTLALQCDPPMVSRAPFIRKLQEDNVRQGFLEEEQYRVLLGCLPPHLKCLLVTGYHVGNRAGELRGLLRSQVDLKAGQISLTGKQTKNRRPRTLPIYGDMLPWFEMQITELEQKWPACPWFFHYHGRRIGSHLKGWHEACKRAGMPGVLFHDLRRSAIRNMERAGVPRKLAMEISGHRSDAIYRRYDIVSDKDLKLAAARMEAYFSDRTGTELGTVGNKTAKRQDVSN